MCEAGPVRVQIHAMRRTVSVSPESLAAATAVHHPARAPIVTPIVPSLLVVLADRRPRPGRRIRRRGTLRAAVCPDGGGIQPARSHGRP